MKLYACVFVALVFVALANAAPAEKKSFAKRFPCIRRNGYLPHLNCAKFIQCSNYRPYVMNCAKGTQWSQFAKRCVHATYCRHAKRVARDVDDQLFESPEPMQAKSLGFISNIGNKFSDFWENFFDNLKNQLEQVEKVDETEDAAADEATADEATADEAASDEAAADEAAADETVTEVDEANEDKDETKRLRFRCPRKSGYYAHRRCNRFVQCSNGIPHVMRCAKGTQYSARLRACVHATKYCRN